jgi:hypothetical protein
MESRQYFIRDGQGGTHQGSFSMTMNFTSTPKPVLKKLLLAALRRECHLRALKVTGMGLYAANALEVIPPQPAPVVTDGFIQNVKYIYLDLFPPKRRS